jgi:acetoin utilization deacetylase AcuC-like enzyme
MAADSNKTGYMFHELYMWHHPGDLHNTRKGVQPTPHWESAESKRRLNNLIHVSGLHDHLITVAPRPATEEELLRCGQPLAAAVTQHISCSMGRVP